MVKVMGQCIINAGWVTEQSGWQRKNPAATMLQVLLALDTFLPIEARQGTPRKV